MENLDIDNDIIIRLVKPLVKIVLIFEPYILPLIALLITYKLFVYFLFTNWNDELFKACKVGKLDRFYECIKQKADLTSRHEENGILPIMIAALNGHLEIIKEIISINKNLVNEKDYQEKSALRYACENNHYEIIKLLIDSGAKIDSKCHNGITPLILAAKAGRVDIVELLVKKSDVKWKSSSGYSAITIAVDQVKDTETCLKILKLLLDNGANIESKTFTGWTSIMKAAALGNIDIVKYLITYSKADIHSQASNGFTALLAACQGGYDDIFQYIISLDSSAISAITKDGTNAFAAACYGGNINIIKYLYEKDKNFMNTKFNNNSSCLMLAISQNNQELCEFLLDNNIDIYTTNDKNHNALTIAVQNSNSVVSQRLIQLDDQNILINQISKDDWTILLMACQKRMTSVVNMILERDTSTINNIQSDGWSALAFGVALNDLEITKLLCFYGADVSLKINPLVLFETLLNSTYQRIKRFQCDKGINSCPLIVVAVVFEYFEIIDILCEYGADLNEKNYGGYNAYDVARYSKRKNEIIKILNKRKIK